VRSVRTIESSASEENGSSGGVIRLAVRAAGDVPFDDARHGLHPV
jgi:hypothetical protein